MHGLGRKGDALARVGREAAVGPIAWDRAAWSLRTVLGAQARRAEAGDEGSDLGVAEAGEGHGPEGRNEVSRDDPLQADERGRAQVHLGGEPRIGPGAHREAAPGRVGVSAPVQSVSTEAAKRSASTRRPKVRARSAPEGSDPANLVGAASVSPVRLRTCATPSSSSLGHASKRANSAIRARRTSSTKASTSAVGSSDSSTFGRAVATSQPRSRTRPGGVDRAGRGRGPRPGRQGPHRGRLLPRPHRPLVLGGARWTASWPWRTRPRDPRGEAPQAGRWGVNTCRVFQRPDLEAIDEALVRGEPRATSFSPGQGPPFRPERPSLLRTRPHFVSRERTGPGDSEA